MLDIFNLEKGRLHLSPEKADGAQIVNFLQIISGVFFLNHLKVLLV